jgi:hypothetical protein
MPRDSDNPSMRPRLPSGLSQFFVPPVPEKIADILGRHLARFSDMENRVDGRFDRLKYKLNDAVETVEKLKKEHEAALPLQAQDHAILMSVQTNQIKLANDAEKMERLVTDIRITIAKYAGAAAVIGALLGYLLSWLTHK